jgi:hypothetical protein
MDLVKSAAAAAAAVAAAAPATTTAAAAATITTTTLYDYDGQIITLFSIKSLAKSIPYFAKVLSKELGCTQNTYLKTM